MSEDHSHSYHETGAAPEVHEHYVSEINGAAASDALHLARKQHDRLVDQVAELAAQVNDLQRQLAAEQETVAAIKNGSVTIPGIVAALRNRAAELTRNIPDSTIECDRHLARELVLIAEAIEVSR